MDYESPFALAKDLGAQIARLVSNLDIDSQPREEREVAMLLKHQVADMRLDIRDYGLAQTRAEQEQLAKEVAERLEQLQATILKASEYNLISAVDVAQLSAGLQQLISVL